MIIAPKPVLDKFIDEFAHPSQSNIKDTLQKNIAEFDAIDFESNKLPNKLPKIKSDRVEFESIDFESDKPIISPYEPESEEEGIYEGLIKPTAKALIKVPASIATSIALLPGAGIASLAELTHVVSSDPDRLFVPWDELWNDAVKTYKQVMSIPSAFITTPAEQKAIENISLVMKPIEWAGKVGGFIGEKLNSGLVYLGLEPTYLEPLLATYGEAALIFGMPKIIKGLKNSNTFRMLSIKERGLVVQSLAETMKKNPGMTEGQLLRTYNNPQWVAEALKKRSIKENYANLKKYAEVKTREVKIKSVMKVRDEELPRPKSIVKSEDVTPTHTFTSKKGNYYYKTDDKWYDNKGKEVTNRFVIRAAEEKQVEVGKIFEEGVEATTEKKIKLSKPEPKVEPEPITELDHQTDVSIPALKSEKSPFFQTREEADAMAKIYEGRKIVDVEVLTQKLINDVNRAYHGDKSVDIAKVRNELSEIASRADELNMAFDNPVDFREWKSTVEEAAIWARRSEPLRLIKKRSEGVELYSGTDPSLVKKLFKSIGTKFTRFVEKNDLKYKATQGNLNIKDRGRLVKFFSYEIKRSKNLIATKCSKNVKKLKNNYVIITDNNTYILGSSCLGETLSSFNNMDFIIFKYSFKDLLKNKTALANIIKKEYLEGLIDKNELNRSRAVLELPEVRGTDPGVQLYSGIDPTLVKKLIKSIAPKWNKDSQSWKFNVKGMLQEIYKDPESGWWMDGQRLTPGTNRPLYLGDTKADAVKKSTELTIESIKDLPGFKLYSGTPLDKAGELIDKIISRYKKRVPEEPPAPFPSVKEKSVELVRRKRGRLNLANYETNKFISKIEQKTTPKQREVFIFALEKTDVPKEFNRPDLQKVLDKDRKHIEAVSKEIKEWFDEGFKKIKYHIPDLSVKQIEDYVTHLWDIPRHKKAEAAAWFSTQNRLLERRFIPTYAEGIKRGYKPKTLDILEIIKTHDSICNRAIENVRFIKNIMNVRMNGAPIIQWGEDIPLDWIEVNYPAITRRIPLTEKQMAKKSEFVKGVRAKAHPELARALKVIFEERFDHPIISAYEAINGIVKKSNLSLSLFHHGTLFETGVALIGFPKTLNIYFNPVKIYKGIVKGEFDIFKKEKIARKSILRGVQYGATADVPVAKIQRYLDDLAKMSANTPLANKITKFLSNFNSVWDKALWSYLHDTLKLYGFESLVSKIDPRLDAAATKRAEEELAQVVNDTLGGQNWDALMISPKEVQMLTWALLSADWTYSTTRQALAPTGIGRIYKETAGLRRKVGWIFWLRAALFFGVGMNMLNAMFRERDMKENPQYYEDREYSYFEKTMFGNTIGKKTYLFRGRYNDGTERYIRWGKQFRDFFELLITPFRKLGGKMAPVPQLMSEVFSGHTLSGFKNDDIYGTKGLEKTKGIFKTIVKAPLPISVKRFMKENMEFKPLDIVMQSSKGMSRYTAMEYFKKAIIEGDEDLLTDTYVGTLRNNLPAFTLFNSALSWVETEIVIDIARDIEGIEGVRSKLSAAKSAYDIKRYGRILRRMERERADKETGLRLLRPAIEKAKIYRDLGLESKSDGRAPMSPSRKGQSNQNKEFGEIRFD